jgi:hypothetical protein
MQWKRLSLRDTSDSDIPAATVGRRASVKAAPAHHYDGWSLCGKGTRHSRAAHRLDNAQKLDSIWYDSEEYAATFVSSSLFLRLYCA